MSRAGSETAATPTQHDAAPPEVEVEETNLGPAVDEFVTELRRRQKPVGVDPDYDLVRDNFDHLHFALQARDNVTPRDPISVHLRKGAKARFSPDVNFSMEKYLERHPESENSDEPSPYVYWLKHGKAAGEIADPMPAVDAAAGVLGVSPIELVDQMAERRADLQERLRTGKLGQMFARAAEIDPLVAGAWPEMTRPKLLPFRDEQATRKLGTIHAAQAEAGHRRARLVIVVNQPRWGGGRRMEGHIAHAITERIDPDEIVVIHTERGGETPPGRYPEGVREIDFAAHARDLERGSAEHTLIALLRSFHADAIVNVNSGTLYRAMRTYGRALCATERVFLCFFCNEQTILGTWYGWPISYFYRLFDVVAGVITDSEYLAHEFEETYLLPERAKEGLHVFRAPVDPEIRPVEAAGEPDPERRPQVFWAGRWDRQKRIGLVLDIARRLPGVDFRMWGEPLLQQQGIGEVPDNVRLEGKYAHFSDLDIANADAWLYTSAWDGVPSLLLEVAMTATPIVGTDVGGTGEVLQDGFAWPMPADAGPEAYASALREIVADTESARKRALDLRERLLQQRSRPAFAEHAGLLLMDSEDGGR